MLFISCLNATPTCRAETGGYPFYSPYGCRLGYHQADVWPVEQKALPPQFIMPMCGEPRHAMAQILDCLQFFRLLLH